MLLLVSIHYVNEKAHILHLLNSQRLSNRVNFDRELFLKRLSITSFESFVVNQVRAFLDENFKNVLYFLIFVTDIECISSNN
jgi:hypothetical protein